MRRLTRLPKSSARRALSRGLLLLVAGCAPRTSETPGPDGDVLTFDAAMLSPREDAGAAIDDDAGSDAGAPTTCTASMSAGGVLTNHPEIAFTNLGGPLVISTAYLAVIERETTNTFFGYCEVENTGTTIQCTP